MRGGGGEEINEKGEWKRGFKEKKKTHNHQAWLSDDIGKVSYLNKYRYHT